MRKALSLLFVSLFCFLSCVTQNKAPTPRGIGMIHHLVESVPIVLYGASGGSGVLFKYKGKAMMLTAAHILVDPPRPINILETEKLFASEPTYGKSIIRIIGHKPNTEFITYNTIGKLITLNPKMDYAIIELLWEESSMSFVTFQLERPMIGTEVYLIGAPLFEPGTLSKGIVCNANRLNPFNKLTYIETDALGSYGSSGGGMFNVSDGKCLGIAIFKNITIGSMLILPTETIQNDLDAAMLTQIDLDIQD